MYQHPEEELTYELYVVFTSLPQSGGRNWCGLCTFVGIRCTTAEGCGAATDGVIGIGQEVGGRLHNVVLRGQIGCYGQYGRTFHRRCSPCVSCAISLVCFTRDLRLKNLYLFDRIVYIHFFKYVKLFLKKEKGALERSFCGVFLSLTYGHQVLLGREMT
jgi:hypothetical protein